MLQMNTPATCQAVRSPTSPCSFFFCLALHGNADIPPPSLSSLHSLTLALSGPLCNFQGGKKVSQLLNPVPPASNLPSYIPAGPQKTECLLVGVGNPERQRDSGKRRCSAETGCKPVFVFVEPVADPRAHERTVSTTLCRAGIKLRDAALGAYCVRGLHWVCVDVVAKDVLGGGGGLSVTKM